MDLVGSLTRCYGWLGCAGERARLHTRQGKGERRWCSGVHVGGRQGVGRACCGRVAERTGYLCWGSVPANLLLSCGALGRDLLVHKLAMLRGSMSEAPDTCHVRLVGIVGASATCLCRLWRVVDYLEPVPFVVKLVVLVGRW